MKTIKRILVSGLTVLLCLMIIRWGWDNSIGRAGENEIKDTTKFQGEEARWLSEWRESVEEDLLYLYAVKLFKAPIACEAKITDTFDGQNFGTLLFSFAGGNTLRIETFPPEASRIALRVPAGFPDEREACSVLEQYLREKGIDIDWSKPTQRGNGAELIISFGPLKPKWNAGAFQVYENRKLVEIAFYLAL